MSTLQIFLITLLLGSSALAQTSDFTTWTQFADPFDEDFDASATSLVATLTAGLGPIAPKTDIAFKSVSGLTPASSLTGFAFSPEADFSIAIDYSLSFTGSPVGFLGLGFGIGEDQDGENSAGVALVTQDGAILTPFGGAAQTGGTEATPLLLSPASLTGSFFVQYTSLSGDILVGGSTIAGAASADSYETFSIIQTGWTDTDLLVSFFLRSADNPFPGLISGANGWQGGGTAEAAFTNFRVLSGSPTSIPEPASLAFALSAFLGLFVIFRRR